MHNYLVKPVLNENMHKLLEKAGLIEWINESSFN